MIFIEFLLMLFGSLLLGWLLFRFTITFVVTAFLSVYASAIGILLLVGRKNSFLAKMPDFIWPRDSNYWFYETQRVVLVVSLMTWMLLICIGPRYKLFRTRDSMFWSLMFLLVWLIVFFAFFGPIAHRQGFI